MADVEHLKAAAREGQGRRRVHDGGVAGRGVALLPQRTLSDRGSSSRGDRGGDALRIRDDHESRHHAADRLPGPRHGAAHPARGPEPSGVAQEGGAPRRGAEPCAGQCFTRKSTHASLLGKLRGTRTTATCALCRCDRHRVQGQAARGRAGSRQPAPRARVGAVRDGQAARRQGAHSGRDRIEVELRRAPRADRATDRALREARRPRERHGRQRLRLRTWVGQSAVDPDVVWAKMAAMAEGARIASRQFWKS